MFDAININKKIKNKTKKSFYFTLLNLDDYKKQNFQRIYGLSFKLQQLKIQ